jgi:hypothetical protein
MNTYIFEHICTYIYIYMHTYINEQRGLPAGTERKTGPGYEEVSIPAVKKTKLRDDEELVDIRSLL